jgi:flagellar biosynthesis regulator FlaF
VYVLGFTESVGSDNETERISFVFKKANNCLKIEYGHKFYDGALVEVSAVTEVEITNFAKQDWVINEKFTGFVSYKKPYNALNYTRKFWRKLTADIFIEEEPANNQLFSNCFSETPPIAIEMNKDGTVDFNLGLIQVLALLKFLRLT